MSLFQIRYRKRHQLKQLELRLRIRYRHCKVILQTFRTLLRQSLPVVLGHCRQNELLADATKPHDDAKVRVKIGNQKRPEPPITPGVMTSRTSENKTTGTASAAATGKKDIGKGDKSGGKADQLGETGIAATTSHIISNVAGRIADSLSNIKDKLIPGTKPNAEQATDKSNTRVENLDHLTQPKPMQPLV